MAFAFDALSFFKYINDNCLAVPSSMVFLGVGIFLTLKTGFVQIRGLPYFFRLLIHGVPKKKSSHASTDTITPIQALFTALATTIGMGNVVGPATAIMMGGPGALVWLMIYMFFASVTKYTEVCFALHTRIKTPEGSIVGGPMEYLRAVDARLATWYCVIMTVLFIGWSGQQSNTLATIYALESIPPFVVGAVLAGVAWAVLSGGAQRVGMIASKLVPVMFIFYVSFALYIIFKDKSALFNALALLKQGFLCASAPVGGFVGASICQAMRYGVFRGIYISESGLGTSSIAHAMSDANNPTDQGILAMGSAAADMFLSFLSGLLILVTGIWHTTSFSTTIMYEAFKIHTPVFGQFILLGSVSLFVLTTVIGNSFNGLKSFTALVGDRWVPHYMWITIAYIFVGAVLPTRLIWEMMDTALTFAAIPNLIGLLYLTYRYPHVIAFNTSK